MIIIPIKFVIKIFQSEAVVYSAEKVGDTKMRILFYIIKKNSVFYVIQQCFFDFAM